MLRILVMLLLLFAMPVYANYKPISTEVSQQYKLEVEEFVKLRYSFYQQEIDSILLEYSKCPSLYEKRVIFEQGINSILLDFYMQILEITNRYVNIKDNIPQTDYPSELYQLLLPYFKENHVNTNKINKLLNYAMKRQKKMEKLY